MKTRKQAKQLLLRTFHSRLSQGKKKAKKGPVRDLNPGPLAPKARIIPLDQRAFR